MSVMSDWSNWVTCGTFSQLRCRLAAPTCIRRVIATSSTSPNLLKSTSGIGGMPAPPVAPAPPDLARCSCSLTKTWTSSLRMRPLGPLAFTSLRLDAELARQHAHRRAGVDLGAVAAGCADRSRGIGLGWRRGRRGGLLLGGGRRGLGRSGCRLLFGCRSGAFHLQLEDQVAGADFVTDLDRDAFHHAGGRRRDLHAGLVGFQGDQRLVGLDRVASLDHHFDDVGLAGRADVRDLDVLDTGRGGGGRLALARGGSRRFGFRRFRLGGRCLGLGFGRLFAAFHFQPRGFRHLLSRCRRPSP